MSVNKFVISCDPIKLKIFVCQIVCYKMFANIIVIYYKDKLLWSTKNEQKQN